jgi:uncharacterized protein YdaU (DUF1376 family)
MSNAPAFQLYAADFYMDTISWPIDAVGIYTRFLFYQWVNGFLPDDEKELSRIAGCGVVKLKKNFNYWSSKFSKRDGNKLINLRLEETRNKQIEFKEKQVKSGSKGGLKKQENLSKRSSEPSSDPISKSISENLPLHSSSSSSNNNLIKANNLVTREMEDLKPAFEEKQEKEKPTEELKPEKSDFIKNLKTVIEKSKARYPDPYQQQQILLFAQSNFRNKNPDAIVHCINSLIKAPDEVKAIRQYLDAALKIEDGKHNARDAEKRCNEFKQLPPNMEAFTKMFSGILKSIPEART